MFICWKGQCVDGEFTHKDSLKSKFNSCAYAALKMLYRLSISPANMPFWGKIVMWLDTKFTRALVITMHAISV